MEMEGSGLSGRSSERKHREEVIDKVGERGEPGVQGFGLSLCRRGVPPTKMGWG